MAAGFPSTDILQKLCLAKLLRPSVGAATTPSYHASCYAFTLEDRRSEARFGYTETLILRDLLQNRDLLGFSAHSSTCRSQVRRHLRLSFEPLVLIVSLGLIREFRVEYEPATCRPKNIIFSPSFAQGLPHLARNSPSVRGTATTSGGPSHTVTTTDTSPLRVSTSNTS